MKLKIVNPDAEDYFESFGISSDRCDYLLKQMDFIVNRIDSRQTFSLSVVHQKIAAICDTPEELTACIFTNALWMQKRAAMLSKFEKSDISHPNLN